MLDISTQSHGVTGHHIGAVQEVSDAPESFCFTLREEGVVADIQARQLRVFGGIASRENFQVKGIVAFGQIFKNQLIAVHFEGGSCAIDHDAGQVQILAVQAQCLGRHIGVAAHAHLVQNARFGGV